MEITKEIIDAINDMLEDDVLSLDEDGRILDYRDVKVDILSTEFNQNYKNNHPVSSTEKIDMTIGECEYMAVSQHTILSMNNCTWDTIGKMPHRWEVADCNARLAVGYAYLLVWDVASSLWLVCGRLPYDTKLRAHDWVANLIHTFINSTLEVPDFAL